MGNQVQKELLVFVPAKQDHIRLHLFPKMSPVHRGHEDLQPEDHRGIPAASKGHSSGTSWWKKQICSDQAQQEVDFSYRHLKSKEAAKTVN